MLSGAKKTSPVTSPSSPRTLPQHGSMSRQSLYQAGVGEFEFTALLEKL
jgi:hypothetical protein